MKISLQVFYFEQAHQSLAAFTSRASRSPSPKKLSEKRVKEKKRPGSRTAEFRFPEIGSFFNQDTHELFGDSTPKPRKESG